MMCSLLDIMNILSWLCVPYDPRASCLYIDESNCSDKDMDAEKP